MSHAPFPNTPVITQRQVLQARETVWSRSKAKPDPSPVQAAGPVPKPAQAVTQSAAPPQGTAPTIVHTVAQKRPLPGGESTKPPPIQLRIGTQGNGDVDDSIVFDGFAQIVPGKRLQDSFPIEFKVESSKANVASLHLSNPEKGTRVFNLLDLEDIILDGEFCLLRPKDGRNYLHVRLVDLEWTSKFQDWMMKLQNIARDKHSQESNAEANVTTRPTTSVEESTPAVTPTGKAQVNSGPVNVAPIVSPPATEAPAVAGAGVDSGMVPSSETPSDQVGAAVAASIDDGQPLITLDDSQQVPLSIANVEDIVNSLSDLVEQVLDFMMPQNQPSSDVIKGIEDAAIEFWQQQGFIDEIDEETRMHISQLVHALVFFKTQAHMRSIGGRFASSASVATPSSEHGAEMEREMAKTIRYTPKELESLRPDRSPCPSEIESLDFLPRATTNVQRQRVVNIAFNPPGPPPQATKATKEDHALKVMEVTKQKDWLNRKDDQVKAETSSLKAIKVEPTDGNKVLTSSQPPNSPGYPHRQYKLDRDLDTPMGNTEDAARAEAKRKEKKGLLNSKWAKAEPEPPVQWSRPAFTPTDLPPTSLQPLHFGGLAAPLNTSRVTPAEQPAGRSASRPNTKGLSSSRYAGEPSQFEGQFTGAS